MIYVGLLHWDDVIDENQLRSALAPYTPSPTVVRKKSLLLCYGKQFHEDIWEDPSGILIGRIFDKTLSCSSAKDFFPLDKEALRKIWGSYVYIKGNQELFEIALDPTGQLPFFYYRFPNGNIVFSSQIEIIFKVLSQKPEIHWSYVCSYITYGNSCTIETPFKDIFELPPGCCLEITKNSQKTKAHWYPSYKTSIIQNNAAHVLKNTLKPFIEPYKNICVSLSGGLDSSSLIYCLKHIKKDDQTLTAINYFHSSVQSSNELPHARSVCQETGIELIEIDLTDTLPFSPFYQPLLLKPNKPVPGLLSLGWTEKVSDHIPSDGIFLSGHGSDHIFMHPPPRKSLSDYLLEKGTGGSRRLLKELTHFYRDSIFSILKENSRSLASYFFYGRKAKRTSTQSDMPPWIKNHLASPNFVHPIYAQLPSKILPAKYDQIDAVYEGVASIHGELPQFHPTYYPFLYEPALEFALSLPTYELFNNGYDRFPLRKAVSDSFKTDTVWRRNKGVTTGVMQLGVKKNLKYLLDLCLEGELVKQGFVDKDGFHEAIVAIGSGDDEHLWPLMHIASTEIFLRSWIS